MADPNPRVRANMVEVYWGDKSREALGVFRRGCHDMHPRVVANAALGLYQAGLIESLSILGTELAGHPESGFRSSAAWAIGCTRDPRFHDLLAKLTRDPDANVRLHAFQSLGEIKRESDRQQSLRHARLHFIKLHRTSDTAPSGGQPRSGLHIFFRVEDEESGAPIPKIRPLEISVAENNEPVLDYRFQERVKYPRPGVYDIHFHSEPLSLNPLPKMLEVSLAIRTETHSGQHSS